jgi:hypothetical protein
METATTSRASSTVDNTKCVLIDGLRNPIFGSLALYFFETNPALHLFIFYLQQDIDLRR